jgi:DNA-binding response OmpR family regulator
MKLLVFFAAPTMRVSTMARILLADDEQAITQELRSFLERGGFEVAIAHSGDRALQLARSLRPDLVVLDVLMPALSGREVCRQLRAEGNWTPVIMLTRVGVAGERAMSLEEGADDYLNKPFDPVELVARIKAVLRRTQPHTQPLASARRLVSGPLILDRPARRAFLAGKEIPLTAKAFAVLEYLMLHPGEVLRRERLLDEIWGWEYPAATRAVDIRVAELRKALGDDAERRSRADESGERADEAERASGPYIDTVVGEGYRFVGRVEGYA